MSAVSVFLSVGGLGWRASLSEKVPDLGEELLVLRGPGGSRGGRFLPHAVRLLHDDEDHEAHDEEVDDRVEEKAVVDSWDSGRFRDREGLGRLAGQVEEEVRKVDLPHQKTDRWHQDVARERRDDLAE